MKRDLYVGLLSGTSVDGVDCALVDFTSAFPIVLAHRSEPISNPLRTAILAASHPGGDDLHQVATLDQQIGKAFAKAVLALLAEAKVNARDIIAIGSHGQTVRHYPSGTDPYTVQIGDPNQIAELTGITTVADFRRRDMAAGGQGAPLAPALHVASFRDKQERRGVLNLGGIANITLIPATHDPADNLGFDTGPSNTLLDAWFRKHKNGDFDKDGHWARQGTVDRELLESMLSEPYLSLSPPKSTGPELFNLQWLQGHMRNRQIPAENVQATLLEFTCRTASDAIQSLPGGSPDRLLVCGGGVHNGALLGRLQELLAPTPIQSTQEYGIPPDWVEAVAFAWLARQSVQGLAGNLPSVTGARHSSVLGAIYPGRLN